MHFLVVLCLVFVLHTYDGAALSVDVRGYVLYCPCMGKSVVFAEGFCRCKVLLPSVRIHAIWIGWLRGSVVERRSLAGVLSLSCAQPVADV